MLLLGITNNVVALLFCALLYLQPDGLVLERVAMLFAWVAAMNMLALIKGAS
jgi:hypothetical protein